MRSGRLWLRSADLSTADSRDPGVKVKTSIPSNMKEAPPSAERVMHFQGLLVLLVQLRIPSFLPGGGPKKGNDSIKESVPAFTERRNLSLK